MNILLFDGEESIGNIAINPDVANALKKSLLSFA